MTTVIGVQTILAGAFGLLVPAGAFFRSQISLKHKIGRWPSLDKLGKTENHRPDKTSQIVHVFESGVVRGPIDPWFSCKNLDEPRGISVRRF